MFQSSQWTCRSPGYWVLSISSARVTAPSGTSSHEIGTETLSCLQPYILGIRLVSLNFVLDMVMLRSNCWVSLYGPVSSPAEPAASVAAAPVAPSSTSPLEQAAKAMVATAMRSAIAI